MRIRALDVNGDWEFGKGLGSYRADQEALAQHIKTRILEWKGDCFFNSNAGVDWYNRIGSKNQQSLLTDEIRSVILRTDGVVSINSLETIFDSSKRQVKINFDITSVYSQSQQQTIIAGLQNA